MTPRELQEHFEGFAAQARRNETLLIEAAWFSEFFARQKLLKSLDSYVGGNQKPTKDEYENELEQVREMAASMSTEDEFEWQR